jgi:uncharacterized membrane protein YvbJ
MSLIKCPECEKEISSKAPACPNCGAPIAADHESIGSGVQHLQTIQETSKKFKVHTLIAVFLIVIGCLFAFIGPDLGRDGLTSAGVLMASIGFVWYLINRFRIWWHHK